MLMVSFGRNKENYKLQSLNPKIWGISTQKFAGSALKLSTIIESKRVFSWFYEALEAAIDHGLKMVMRLILFSIYLNNN